MNSDYRIRDLAESDSIAAITELLHAAYAHLAKSGFRYHASHQEEATTLRRLLRGVPFVADSGGEIIGTVTLYRPNSNSPCEWYRQANVFRFGQFAVRPDLQRNGIGLRLYEHVETTARSLGAAELALDTAEGALHLREWYEKLGFRFIQFVSWDITNYRSVVLSKSLDGTLREKAPTAESQQR